MHKKKYQNMKSLSYNKKEDTWDHIGDIFTFHKN